LSMNNRFSIPSSLLDPFPPPAHPMFTKDDSFPEPSDGHGAHRFLDLFEGRTRSMWGRSFPSPTNSPGFHSSHSLLQGIFSAPARGKDTPTWHSSSHSGQVHSASAPKESGPLVKPIGSAGHPTSYTPAPSLESRSADVVEANIDASSAVIST